MPIKAAPSIIKKMPDHFEIFIFSPRNFMLNKAAHTFPKDDRGYKTESSPPLNATIENPIPEACKNIAPNNK